MRRKPAGIVFNIRQWWDRANGNTYCKGEATLIYRDGSTREIPISYRNDQADNAEHYVTRDLIAAKLMPEREQFEASTTYYERHKIARVRCYCFVPTKKEL